MAAETPNHETLRASPEPESAVKRLPYIPPRLRHLGSVRELTLGNSNKFGEGQMMNM
jgi:hypothetical protein